MAKKKTKQQQAFTISPKKYMQTKVRNLPIEECLISEGWQEAGECNLIIARKHASGNFTIGIFLVDLYCLGVKDCFYKYNIPEYEYYDIKKENGLIPISYDETHNIIYGAVAYAEDLGIAPHEEFDITQYILEPDTDDIPLIEYEFGRDGKPFLIVDSKAEANRYLPILRKHAGDDFEFSIKGEDVDFENDLYLNEISEKLRRMQEHSKRLPHTGYAYSYPDYPKELKLNHEELTIFFLPDNSNSLTEEEITGILSLPRKTLVEDLENIILFEIGRTYGEIAPELWEEDYSAPLTHALFFLGELRAEEALDVVLEVMRQNESFCEFHFGDAGSEILPLTLYYVGRNQLSKLADYAKEPGLYPYLKIYLFTAMPMIAVFEPERRNEVIDRYKEILNFYMEKVEDSAFFDSELTGMMMSDLLDIKAVELLPEIKRLYATNQVDEMCCGNYEDIENEMRSKKGPLHEYSPLNIYERYKLFEKHWGN